MDDGLQVDLDRLDDIVARLSGLAGFITEKLDAIDHAVTNLGPTVWNSEAAAAYQDAHRRWATQAHDFADGVRTAHEAARLAHEKVRRAVELNGRMLHGE
ncbi:WXG100 family type VII secretion target [Nocardia sp. BMG111209]|uniref:WXG100 family type VII secretion target n=1 Tax=Nocardia sp. BMG111209 TaxID=1160137 RepID=UPI0003746C2F|nr:WXG100 family type VII secretion target [Nocardia sp. BMG111209]